MIPATREDTANREAWEAYMARARDERWTITVREHGEILWRAAAVADRSPKIRCVLQQFTRHGEITTAQGRMLWAIVRDLERHPEAA